MLTLEEIENISFRRAGIGGYKTDDVDNFIDSVIIKVKNLQTVNKELENRIEQLNTQIQVFKERQESVQDAIITAEITSKSVIKEANHKAEVLVADANAKAENLIKEATEKSEKMVSDANKKSESVISNAVRDSIRKVNENNRILEKQDALISELRDEVKRFQESLVAAYKNHIALITSLPDADELEEYQDKLDDYYTEETNANNIFNDDSTDTIADNTIIENVEESEAEEEAEEPMTDSISQHNIVEDKESDVIFSSAKNEQEYKSEKPVRKVESDSEAEDMPMPDVSVNNRQPIMHIEKPEKKSDAKFSILKLDDEQD